jgi:DNA-binding transcriptional LysR family regulator
VLPRAIATFRETHPDAVFEIETLHLDELYDALRESRVDIGIAFDPAEQQGVTARKISSAQFYVLAHRGSELDDKSAMTLDDLRDRPFIGLNSRGPLGQALNDYLEDADIDPQFVAWTETYHVAKALVASGAGITITDEITARSRFAGDLMMLPLKPAVKFDITLLQRADAPLSLAAKEFQSHLGKCVKALLKGN